MDDLISRQAAIDAIRDMQAFEDDNGQPYLYLYDVMAVFTDEEELPPAQPKRGKWTLKSYRWKCDQCGCLIRRNPFKGNKWNYNYCPNCGADMREVNHESN